MGICWKVAPSAASWLRFIHQLEMGLQQGIRATDRCCDVQWRASSQFEITEEEVKLKA